MTDLVDTIRNPARLHALQRTALLDSPTEQAFDRLTRLAATILEVPVALVSLVDENRQFFKSCVGLPEPWASARETPLSHSFCQHTVHAGEPFVVADARTHPLVRDNLAIPDLDVIAYAGIPLVTSSGEVLGSFCAIDNKPRLWMQKEIDILRDLTGSVVAEIELRTTVQEAEQARAETRAVLDATEEAMILVGPDRRFITVNRRFSGFFGIGADEVVGRRFDEVAPLMQRAFINPDAFLGWVAAGPLRDTEQVFRTTVQQGWPQPRELDVTSTVVRQTDGSYLGRLFVVRDVTQERTVDRMKSQFVSVVSHEFRTPLTGIQGFSEMIRDEDLSIEEIKDFANDINEDAKRLARLVGDMLDLDRLESGRLELSLSPVDLTRLVTDVANFARPNAPTHTIRLDLEGLPALVADRDRLVQVITNLLGNAIKYSPEGGEITLRTRQEADQVVLEVRDQGLGIPPDQLGHIFDRYARVEAGAARTIQGTGLGLPIARQIVRLHGGDITVESTPGHGSTFRVELPLAGPAGSTRGEA